MAIFSKNKPDVYSQVRSAGGPAVQKRWDSLTQAQRDKVLDAASNRARKNYQQNWAGVTGSSDIQARDDTLAALPAEVRAAILGGSAAVARGSGGSGGSSAAGGGVAGGGAEGGASGGETTPAGGGATVDDTVDAQGRKIYAKDPWGTQRELTLKNADDLEAMGLSLTSKEDYESLKATYSQMRRDLGLSAEKMNAANEAFLRGDIPADVAAQIKRQTGEAAQTGGIFGTGGRALTAADFGLTSMQLIQQGIQQQGSIAGVQEVVAKLDESIRQFNKNYDLSVNSFQDKVRNTNLTGLALEESRLEFNAKQNLAITELMTNMVTAQQELGLRYSTIGVDSSGPMQTFDNLISQLSGQLSS